MTLEEAEERVANIRVRYDKARDAAAHAEHLLAFWSTRFTDALDTRDILRRAVLARRAVEEKALPKDSEKKLLIPNRMPLL